MLMVIVTGDDSVENGVMQRNIENGDVEDEIYLKLTWSHMLLKKTVY